MVVGKSAILEQAEDHPVIRVALEVGYNANRGIESRANHEVRAWRAQLEKRDGHHRTQYNRIHRPILVRPASCGLAPHRLLTGESIYSGNVRLSTGVRMRQRIVISGLILALAATSGAAQTAIIARDGWEAFPNVEYLGGDATQPKRLRGMLVLTDSTISLHQCEVSTCNDLKSKPAFKPIPIYTIRLSTLKGVQNAAQQKGAGLGEKILVGGLLSDQKVGTVVLTYESTSSAEAPVFKTDEAHGAALEAKIRFRLKKLGIELPAGK
jgi:hypothetical protein